jgi:hypothetical protein
MNTTAYDCLANTYTVTRDKVYVLKPIEKKMFRTWRKERIQKLKEQDEEEIMAESAPIFSAIVQSGVTIVALETDSKPRTVSHEEGEDDTAPNTVYYNMHTNVAKDIEEQVSTLHPPNVRST